MIMIVHAQSRKDRLPRDLCYPLRFADIEACAGLLKGEEVHLRAFFHRLAHFDKVDRDYAKESHQHLLVDLRCEIDPGPDSFVYRMCRRSEVDIVNIGVHASVTAIARAEWRASGARRSDVCNLACEQVQQLVREQESLARCDLAIALDVPARTLRWRRTYWRHGIIGDVLRGVVELPSGSAPV